VKPEPRIATDAPGEDLVQIYRCWSGSLRRIRKHRSALFRRRLFEDEIMICVRWYLRYSRSYRDLEEMLAERGLSLNHSTIWR